MAYWDTESDPIAGNPIYLYRFFGDTLGDYLFTTSLFPITLSGDVYAPWPVRHDPITTSMSPDRKDMKITMGQGSLLDDLYTAYPPTESLYISVRRTHSDLPSITPLDAPQLWSGRVMGVEYQGDSQVEFICEPLSTASRRPGLRRNYQLNCPFLLYGPECKANKAAATTNVIATYINESSFSINLGLDYPRYYGGVAEWINSQGHREAHTIKNMAGFVVTIGGRIRDLPNGTTVSLSYGCDHSMEHCLDLHNNILNFGGMPWIPLQNPMDNLTSVFY